MPLLDILKGYFDIFAWINFTPFFFFCFGKFRVGMTKGFLKLLTVRVQFYFTLFTHFFNWRNVFIQMLDRMMVFIFSSKMFLPIFADKDHIWSCHSSQKEESKSLQKRHHVMRFCFVFLFPNFPLLSMLL